MKEFEITTHGMVTGTHIKGDKNCPDCDSNDDSDYPIPCDLCGKGLMHAEDGFAYDGEGGICQCYFYLCDSCDSF
jgi:hypothetical protein